MKTIHHLKVLSVLAVSLCTQLSYAQYTNPDTENDNNHHTNSTDKVKIKHSIISFGFFSPLNGHLSFGYDQLIHDDFVLTTQLGIIGIGINHSSSYYNTRPPYGAFIEAGAKMFFSPTWIMDGMRRYNKMQGGYFKPQVIFSMFSVQNASYKYTYYPYPTSTVTTNDQNYSALALMLNLGKQWVFSNSFVLDIYAGIGYSITLYPSGTTTPYGAYLPAEAPGGNYFSFLSGGGNFPIAFTAGVNLGLPF